MDKKISLEHAVRNVMQESIGGPNTDKFKGTPKPFLQPAPHIEPKVGDSHPDASVVTSKRGNAKIQQSETMREEQIEEGKLDLLKLGVKAAEKGAEYADDVAKSAKEFTKDFWSKIKPAEKEAETLPNTKPTEQLPAKIEPKPEVKTEPKVEVKPETKTQTLTKTEPKVEVKPETKTQTLTKPKIDKPIPPLPPGGSGGGGKGGQRRGFAIPGVHPDIVAGLNGYVPVKTIMHYASDRVSFGEEVERKRAKTAEIKLKIIDENNKRASIIKKAIEDKKSTVILNPKLKNPEADKPE